jgi:hypothetical protein
VQLELKLGQVLVLVPAVGLCGPRNLISRRVDPAHCTLIIHWPNSKTRLTKIRRRPNQRSCDFHPCRLVPSRPNSCPCFDPVSDHARVQYAVGIGFIEPSLIIGFRIVFCLWTVQGIPARKQESGNRIESAPT